MDSDRELLEQKTKAFREKSIFLMFNPFLLAIILITSLGFMIASGVSVEKMVIIVLIPIVLVLVAGAKIMIQRSGPKMFTADDLKPEEHVQAMAIGGTPASGRHGGFSPALFILTNQRLIIQKQNNVLNNLFRNPAQLEIRLNDILKVEPNTGLDRFLLLKGIMAINNSPTVFIDLKLEPTSSFFQVYYGALEGFGIQLAERAIENITGKQRLNTLTLAIYRDEDPEAFAEKIKEQRSQ